MITDRATDLAHYTDLGRLFGWAAVKAERIEQMTDAEYQRELDMKDTWDGTVPSQKYNRPVPLYQYARRR